MRRELKSVIELGLVWSGAERLARRAHRGRTLILAYHDIVPHGAVSAGDASLHLSQRRFAAQLDALAESHDVVPLAVALAPAASASGRPRVAITFDDAYHGAVTVGVSELARRGLPATIFVPPGLLGGLEFWWDALTPPGASLDRETRTRALTAFAGKSRMILDDAARSAAYRRQLPRHARSATEDELCRAAATPGITIGSHTWSHPNLPLLDAPELDDELRRPLSWLRERFEGVLPVLTYPYGLHSPAVKDAARGAGYAAALRIDGGWIAGGDDPFALPRLDVPAAVSDAGFRLRAAGLLS